MPAQPTNPHPNFFVTSSKLEGFSAPWIGGFQRLQIPPGKGSLQPVAIGAAAVTKPSEPSRPRVTPIVEVILRTRRPERAVNAEQASKYLTRVPSRRSHGEGRRWWSSKSHG